MVLFRSSTIIYDDAVSISIIDIVYLYRIMYLWRIYAQQKRSQPSTIVQIDQAKIWSITSQCADHV